MKKNTEKEDARAYKAFYKEVFRRLARKQKAVSKRLAKDENPVLSPVREGLAELNMGGKMLRGMLVVLGYKIALGAAAKESKRKLRLASADTGDENELPANEADLSYADDLALAFETFQTGILVHDDIIDNAELRRGKETVHRRYRQHLTNADIRMVAADEPGHLSDSIAICAGDFALYEAVRSISQKYMGEEALGSLISYFSEVVLDTIRGELLDVMLPYELQTLSEAEAGTLLEKSVEEIYRLKTAGYSVVGPLHLGMLLGGASTRQMRSLDAVAMELGVAYQIMDDILGIFADEKELGKDVGSDISEFKQTILYMYVRTRRPEHLPELLEYYGKPAGYEELSAVKTIFEESGALAYAKEEMEKLSSLRFLAAEDKAILRGFICYCRGRKY